VSRIKARPAKKKHLFIAHLLRTTVTIAFKDDLLREALLKVNVDVDSNTRSRNIHLLNYEGEKLIKSIHYDSKGVGMLIS
jgi:hypothetical protein